MMQQSPTQTAVQEEALARLVTGLKGAYAELEMERANLVRQLETTTGDRHQAVEERLTTNHVRMDRMQAQITAAETQLALIRSRDALPQTLVPPPVPQGPSFPPQLIAIPALTIICIGLPLAIAYARRIWRKADALGSAIPREVLDRLERIDRNVDAIALEVERIGESQRYLAKQQAEHLAIARESDSVRH